MRTGLTKKQKTTVIYFDEYGGMIEGQIELPSDCPIQRGTPQGGERTGKTERYS